MSSDNIISISVTISPNSPSTSVSRVPALLCPHTNFVEKAKTYDPSEPEDRFSSGDTVYDALKKVSDQGVYGVTPSNVLVGRIQVDTAKGTVLPVGQIETGISYTIECADLADSSVTTLTHVTAPMTDTITGGATGAGTSTITFGGDADDAGRYLTGYSFTVSGEATPANDGDYEVVAPGATHLGGVVTIPVDRTITIGATAGTLSIKDDNLSVATALSLLYTGSALTGSAADNGDGTFSITTATAGNAMIFRTTNRDKVYVTPQTLGGTGSTDAAKWYSSLDAILAAGYNFTVCYPLIWTPAIHESVDEWCFDNEKKLQIAVSNNSDLYTKTTVEDLSSTWGLINAENRKRTYIAFSSETSGSSPTSDDNFIGSAILGRNIAADLDTQYTEWAYKRMQGINGEDVTTLPTSARTILASKLIDWPWTYNIGTSDIRTVMDGGSTSSGTVGKLQGGVSIATQLAVWGLEDDIRNAVLLKVFDTYDSQSVISYLQTGMDDLLSSMRPKIKKWIDNKFLTFDRSLDQNYGYSLTVPARDTIDESVVDSSVLNNIQLKANRAGSILKVNIDFSVN